MDATFWAPFLRITSVILESSRSVPLPVRITSSTSWLAGRTRKSRPSNVERT